MDCKEFFVAGDNNPVSTKTYSTHDCLMRLGIHVCDGKLPYFVAYEIRHGTPLEYAHKKRGRVNGRRTTSEKR